MRPEGEQALRQRLLGAPGHRHRRRDERDHRPVGRSDRGAVRVGRDPPPVGIDGAPCRRRPESPPPPTAPPRPRQHGGQAQPSGRPEPSAHGRGSRSRRSRQRRARRRARPPLSATTSESTLSTSRAMKAAARATSTTPLAVTSGARVPDGKPGQPADGEHDAEQRQDRHVRTGARQRSGRGDGGHQPAA